MFLLVTTIPLWLHFSSEDPSGKISVDIDRKVIEEPKELEEPKKEEMPIELPQKKSLLLLSSSKNLSMIYP